MFIDELYTCDCDVRGIQLLPNLTEIFLLMFEDDIALIADTVVGLQRQLKGLNDFYQRSKRVVNIRKTKLMVFERGGALARSEKWTFNNCKIEVINGFTYVGLLFTNILSMYQITDAMSGKAKKALNCLLHSLHQFPCLSYSTFFKLIDSKIAPIMLYGSELWGLKNVACIGNVHI